MDPQPQPEPHVHAEISRWKDLASRCRQMSKHTTDELSRNSLIEMAVEYESLVAEAEKRDENK